MTKSCSYIVIKVHFPQTAYGNFHSDEQMEGLQLHTLKHYTINGQYPYKEKD